jgi:hypothetical protein
MLMQMKGRGKLLGGATMFNSRHHFNSTTTPRCPIVQNPTKTTFFFFFFFRCRGTSLRQGPSDPPLQNKHQSRTPHPWKFPYTELVKSLAFHQGVLGGATMFNSRHHFNLTTTPRCPIVQNPTKTTKTTTKQQIN